MKTCLFTQNKTNKALLIIGLFVSFFSVAYSGDDMESNLMPQTTVIFPDKNNNDIIIGPMKPIPFDLNTLLPIMSLKVSFLESAQVHHQYDLNRVKNFLVSCPSVQPYEQASQKLDVQESIEVQEKRGSPPDTGVVVSQKDSDIPPEQKPPEQKRRYSQRQSQKQNGGGGKKKPSASSEKLTVPPAKSTSVQSPEIKKDKKVYLMHDGRIVVEDD